MRHTIKDNLKALLGVEDSPTDAIHILKEDHNRVEDLFKDFEKASTKAQKQKIMKQVVMELTVHAALEEKLVYPLIAYEGDKTREAYEEHHLVKLTLAEMEKMNGSEENAKAKMKVLSELVKHHVKEEERELLPSLKHSDNDMEKLGKQLLAEKQKMMDAMKSGSPATPSKTETTSSSSKSSSKTAGKGHRKTAATSSRRTASRTSAGRKKTMTTASSTRKKSTASSTGSKRKTTTTTGGRGKSKTTSMKRSSTRGAGSRTTMKAGGSQRKKAS